MAVTQMKISQASWEAYVSTLAKINKKAAVMTQAYIDRHGVGDTKRLVDFANEVIKTYGSANGALACQMYNELARLQDASVPDAEMAELPDYPEVARAVYGTINNQHSTIPATVERMTKQVGADTMLKNARRDNAEWAWVPNGAETCAFCITLASQGWMPASRAQLNGSHAEHIHANCMCEFAIRFDGETEIDGYDPDKYYDMYMNASDDNDSVKKINALRRKLYEAKGENHDTGT